MTNIRSFQSGLVNFGGSVFESHGRVIKRVARQITTDVIDNTPINVRDESHAGHAKANWQIGINSVPANEIDGVDPDGGRTVANCMAVISAVKSGDIVSLVNNVPYIQALEEGHSSQAPAGMVSVAIARAIG